MADLSLPLINIDNLQYHNFYNVCIKSIKKHKSIISHQSELIHRIEGLRDLNAIKIRKKIFPNFANNEIKRNGMKTDRIYKIPNNKKTLVKILLELSEYDIKQKELKKKKEKEKNQNKNSNDSKDNNNKDNINKDNINKDNINKDEEKKESEKNKNKNKEKSENKEEKNDINKAKKVPKNCAILRGVLEYLESNDITLFEYIKRNPFQKGPYQLSKSFELFNAVKFKNYNYVIEALQNKKDYLFSFDYFGQTCYHWAAKLSNIKMLKILITFGKYLNQKDYSGRTPLYLASINNDQKICEILIKNGANVHLKDNKGKTAIDIAGSKELKYYLQDFITQPYSNLSCRQRVADYLRTRDDKIEKRKMMVRLKRMEEEEKRRKEKEEAGEEENIDKEE